MVGFAHLTGITPGLNVRSHLSPVPIPGDAKKSLLAAGVLTKQPIVVVVYEFTSERHGLQPHKGEDSSVRPCRCANPQLMSSSTDLDTTVQQAIDHSVATRFFDDSRDRQVSRRAKHLGSYVLEVGESSSSLFL